MSAFSTCVTCRREFVDTSCPYCALDRAREEHARRVEEARRKLEGVVPPREPEKRSIRRWVESA